MTTKIAQPVFICSPSEVLNCAVDVRGMLRKDASDSLTELATGTPTISDPTGITTASVSVNSSAEIIRKVSVPAGGAIKFKATVGSSASDGTVYAVITFATDSTPAQSRKIKVGFKIEAD